MRLAAILVLGCAVTIPMTATNFFDLSATVDIFVGTANLHSPDGQLLSTTNAMTVETAFDLSNPTPEAASYFLPPMVQSLVQQIQSNANGYNLPSRFSDNLQNFENATALGILISPPTLTATWPDTPASQQLYSTLTTQSVPFTITSDTGDVNYVLQDQSNDQFAQYFIGPFIQATTGDNYSGIVDVNLVDRTIEERVAPAPEPRHLLPLGLLAGLGFSWWRRRTYIGTLISRQ